VKAMRNGRSAQARRRPRVPVLAAAAEQFRIQTTRCRDLTGRGIFSPTREFPGGSCESGPVFDNSGESLQMSPSLLNKYLQAAHEVGDHIGADAGRDCVRTDSDAGRDR